MRRIVIAFLLLALPAVALAINWSVWIVIFHLENDAGAQKALAYEKDIRGNAGVADWYGRALDRGRADAIPGWRVVSREECGTFYEWKNPPSIPACTREQMKGGPYLTWDDVGRANFFWSELLGNVRLWIVLVVAGTVFGVRTFAPQVAFANPNWNPARIRRGTAVVSALISCSSVVAGLLLVPTEFAWIAVTAAWLVGFVAFVFLAALGVRMFFRAVRWVFTSARSFLRRAFPGRP